MCRTTQIDQANAPCSTDESGFCARTIESGLYTCDEDYCSVSYSADSADATISLLDLPIHPPDSNEEVIGYMCACVLLRHVPKHTHATTRAACPASGSSAVPPLAEQLAHLSKSARPTAPACVTARSPLDSTTVIQTTA